jgi:hypothetical protein
VKAAFLVRSDALVIVPHSALLELRYCVRELLPFAHKCLDSSKKLPFPIVGSFYKSLEYRFPFLLSFCRGCPQLCRSVLRISSDRSLNSDISTLHHRTSKPFFRKLDNNISLPSPPSLYTRNSGNCQWPATTASQVSLACWCVGFSPHYTGTRDWKERRQQEGFLARRVALSSPSAPFEVVEHILTPNIYNVA